MLDFRILAMRNSEDERYQIATVLSHRDQNEYVLHNRWGSWMIGSPSGSGSMREAAVISPHLAAALQEWRAKGKIEATPPPKVNPFIKKAAKSNPMIAALLKKNKIQ